MLIYRTILAIAAMALSAAAVLALPGFSPEVEASAPAAVQHADRVDVLPAGKACSQQAWPYYEAQCLRDHAGQVRTVRVIALDKTK